MTLCAWFRGATLAVASVGLLSIPAEAEFPSHYGRKWEFGEHTDKITDQRVRTIMIYAMHGAVPWGFVQAPLNVRCTAGNAELTIKWAEKTASNVNLVVEYRFDGLPGRSLDVRYVNRSEQRSTSVAGIRQFLADARRSDRLLLRVSSDLLGTTEAVFRAGAGAEVADYLIAACPKVG